MAPTPGSGTPQTAFVWFFGPSGAGKETAIQTILDDQRHPLRQLLALEGPVAASNASRDTTALRLRGELLLESILGDTVQGVTLLIKGQAPDIESTPPAPRVLKGRAGDAIHRVAFLWASPAELNRRCVERGWPDSLPSHVSELEGQIHRVTNLAFPTEWIRSSDARYEVIQPSLAG